ncbi:MAG: hypothetical protein EZS28_025605, partial [Streblomastix strix]
EEKVFCYNGLLALLMKIYQFGKVETKQQFKKEISIEHIDFLKKSEYNPIFMNAVKLMKLINEDEEKKDGQK